MAAYINTVTPQLFLDYIPCQMNHIFTLRKLLYNHV